MFYFELLHGSGRNERDSKRRKETTIKKWSGPLRMVLNRFRVFKEVFKLALRRGGLMGLLTCLSE